MLPSRMANMTPSTYPEKDRMRIVSVPIRMPYAHLPDCVTGLVTGPLGWSRRGWIVRVSGATAVIAVYIVGTRLPF